MTFDETVTAMGGLVGQRVDVAIGQATDEGLIGVASMHGVLRDCEPDEIRRLFGDDAIGNVAGWYVHGGQELGEVPAVWMHRWAFVAVGPPDDAAPGESPAVGINWGTGLRSDAITFISVTLGH
jgi:hypothetical protein